MNESKKRLLFEILITPLFENNHFDLLIDETKINFSTIATVCKDIEYFTCKLDK